MKAVLSSAVVVHADAARAAKHYAQRGPDADNHSWSALPDDLLVTIMAQLDIQSLRHTGAVCKSWREAHNFFRLPEVEKAPCMLYACEEFGPNDVALYCPTTDTTFRMPFPGQPHFKRGFTFSCPGGWVFTTDEVGDPYLINPLTGVQATLPPVKTIYHNDTYYDDAGKHVWHADPEMDTLLSVSWARHVEYVRVAISAAVEVTECTVLIVHMPECRLSFARPGDKRWTLVSKDTSYISDIIYNDKDGLFYALGANGSISTIDLSGPSPSVTKIMDRVLRSIGYRNMYLAHGSSGELLQIWRTWCGINRPLKFRETYQDIVEEIYEDCVELAGDDKNEDKLSEVNTNDELYDVYETIATHQDIDASETLREGIDLLHRLVDEVTTTMVLVFRVDIKRQKLVELRDIGEHALFLGLSSAVCVATKDYPVFEPNCAYLTDDCLDYSPMLRKDLGIWNINKRSMQKLGEAWPNMHPWIHLPAPIWIMPRF